MTNSKTIFNLLVPALAISSGCSDVGGASEQSALDNNLATAEKMIDAFYSFDADLLRPFLAKAEKSAQSILYYQGWAEGGNYKVLERPGCAPTESGKIACPVTVQDDPVMALKTGFMVTDTFTLTFDGADIVDIETSSNDQPIYYEARKWVEKNMPEVMSGPCLKTEDGGGPTPGDCARAMTEGYRQFMLAKESESGAATFIPPTFNPPRLVEAQGFKLVPLGPDLAKIDYDAYMSSIEHLQTTFTRSTKWPTADLDAEDALLDMQNEERRFLTRESFAYAVLTPDGLRERGCVYVRPSDRAEYDAVVRLWVTKAEYDAGFDEDLYAWTQQWVGAEWPFKRIAYPGREIPWSEWDSEVTPPQS